MRAIMIGYDINDKGDNYSARNKVLREAIEAISGTWWHHLDSTYIVATDLSCVEIRDYLQYFVDQKDEILVAELTGTSAWFGINQRGSNWLHNNILPKVKA